ncbi:MAG: 30S ribosomal protein S8 [Candidatus Vogelbacteria bacterium]|nr:30S ribosomal protein S8 [Candidatus Vogelbacteria bacterium]
MVADPIADFLVQLKNAGSAKKEYIVAPFSNVKMEIAKLLEREGYIQNVSQKGKKIKKYLYCELVYGDKAPKISEFKRVSKTSCRVYVKNHDLKPVKQGFGLAVVSTSRGLMTSQEAKREKIGGELMFNLW